jgi:hypothetical protein
MRKVLYSFDIVLEEGHFRMLLDRIDADGDGAVSYLEFLRYFGKGRAGDRQVRALQLACPDATPASLPPGEAERRDDPARS